MPADVVTSYQGLLCSLTHCSLPARDVIQEKGGLQLARCDISVCFVILLNLPFRFYLMVISVIVYIPASPGADLRD